MSQVREDVVGGLIWVEDDPGVPSDQLHDPFAGLGESAAAGVCLLLSEGKAIGSAQLKANVGTRDAALRTRSLTMRTRQRFQMSAAAKNAARDIKRITQETRRAVQPIFEDFLAGAIDLREAQTETAIRWSTGYEKMRDVGRAASALSRMADVTIMREEETWFRGAVREEVKFFNTFLAEIREGRVGHDRARARFGHYLQAMRFMYESARVQALPDTVLLYWAGPRDERRCPGCVYMTERSPFPKDVMPASPRDGSTRCLVHCRHRIVVRVPALQEDVERRRQALPKRETMVRELKALARRQRGLARPGGRAQNPFRGRPITAPPSPAPFTFRGRPVRLKGGVFVRESVEDTRALAQTILARSNPEAARELRMRGINESIGEDLTAPKVGGDVDVGARGKEFEAALVKGLRILGLKFSVNRATGAVWDIRPEGAGWHRFVKDRNTNLKVHSTRWLFSDAATYKTAVKAQKMVAKGTLTPEEADTRVANTLKRSMNKKGATTTAFMKPSTRAVQSGIVRAAKAKDKDALSDLLRAANFATKRLGRSFSVSVQIAWDKPGWADTATIRIDGGGKGGGKRMGITGRARKVSGAWAFFFRDRTATPAKPHHRAHTVGESHGKDAPHKGHTWEKVKGTATKQRCSVCDKRCIVHWSVEATDEKEPQRESVGIFLRVPPDLAKQFPSLDDEDKSPPHATMLFVGDCDGFQYSKVVDACREVCSQLPAFKVSLDDYGEFENPKGQTIAHMIPRSDGGPQLADIHTALRAAVLARGIPVEHHSDGPFKPHVTLAYIDSGKRRYSGPRPKGTFWLDHLEVWGSGVWGDGVLPNTPVPLGETSAARIESMQRVVTKLTEAVKDSTIKVDVAGDEDGNARKMLDHIGKIAGHGHSFLVVVDPETSEYKKTYSFDGDGSFRLAVSEGRECVECREWFAFDRLVDGNLYLGEEIAGICDGPDEFWCVRCAFVPLDEERLERSGAVKVGMDAWSKAHLRAVAHKKEGRKKRPVDEQGTSATIPDMSSKQGMAMRDEFGDTWFIEEIGRYADLRHYDSAPYLRVRPDAIVAHAVSMDGTEVALFVVRRYKRSGTGKWRLYIEGCRRVGKHESHVGMDAREDDLGIDPGVRMAVKRAGFPDVQAARTAAQAKRDRAKVAKLPKRVRHKLVGRPKDGDGEGPETLTDRLAKARARVEVVEGDLQQNLLRWMRDNRSVVGWDTARNLAEVLGVSIQAVQGTLRKLQVAGRVERHPEARTLWRLVESLGDSLDEGVSSTWDSVPYSSMRLQDVARMFAGLVKQRTPNRNLIMKVMERLMGTLAFSTMAIMGRAEADRTVKLIRDGIEALLDRAVLGEGDGDAVNMACRLRRELVA